MSEPGATAAGWMLLLAQLPAAPSSARVTLWRRARGAGAVGLQNGAWVLPCTPAHEELLTRLAGTVREQGGSGFALRVQALVEGTDAEIVARFRADRAKEYDEFAERGGGLLAEIAKESGRGKFSFAELEEIEQDLDRLTGWLAKITARDFFPDDRAEAAAALLHRCRCSLQEFTGAVYRAEGLSSTADAAEPSPDPTPQEDT